MLPQTERQAFCQRAANRPDTANGGVLRGYPGPTHLALRRQFETASVSARRLRLVRHAHASGSDGHCRGRLKLLDIAKHRGREFNFVIHAMHERGRPPGLAGQFMEVFDGATGEARQAVVFFAVLGASSYTYSEAVGSQPLPEWISAHVFDGLPRQFVCDNLRSGITRACFYELLVNRTHADSRSICPRCSGWHRAFRVCRMEALARQSRLSCRDRTRQRRDLLETVAS